MDSAQLSVKELGFKPGANAGIWVRALVLSYLGRRWTDSRVWTVGTLSGPVSTLSCLGREGLGPPLPLALPLSLHYCLLILVPFQNLTSQGSRPFCAACKALFFVIIIFFHSFFLFFSFLLESRNLLTGKSVLELGEVCFLFHAKAITGLSGPEPTHVCTQTVQLPSPHPGKVCPAVRLEPARPRVMQTRQPGKPIL